MLIKIFLGKKLDGGFLLFVLRKKNISVVNISNGNEGKTGRIKYFFENLSPRRFNNGDCQVGERRTDVGTNACSSNLLPNNIHCLKYMARQRSLYNWEKVVRMDHFRLLWGCMYFANIGKLERVATL